MKQGGLYQNKVNSSLASIFNYKMGYSKEQRWILNSTGLPKLQEITELFRKKNTATWRPSSLQFRHSYIIKHLVRRLSQPMIARRIKTARSLQILHEIGQILSHQRTGKELVVQECFDWSNAATWCFTWKITQRVDRGLWCKENGTFQRNTIKSKKQKAKNVTITSSKRTQSFSLRAVMIAQWARGALSKVLYEEGPPTFPPPPPLSFFYIPFLTEKVPVSYTIYWQMTPPLIAVNALFFTHHE